jgi:dihydrodipicolinate synthase/N-acetylneuraminate lyase
VKQFRGIFSIITAPFKEDLSLDKESVERTVDFCIEGGSHGIVVPVNASEFTVLTDTERNDIVRWTVERTGGRIPVIAGVAAPSVVSAVDFAKYARKIGADGVIAMPPYITKASTVFEIKEYYRKIADACELPVFIQNYIGPVGTPMNVETCIEIIQDVDGINYVKEETDFSGHFISQLQQSAESLEPGRFLGVMGGKAGRYLIDEYNRGAIGNMPACEIADIQARIWDYLEAGETDNAVDIYNKIMPLMNIEYMYGPSIYKEVLKRRGVIQTGLSRTPGHARLDKKDMRELDRILKEIEPLFRV